MEPALVVTALWLAFGGTHVGLAAAPIRGALVQRLGARGFGLVFSAVAAITFALLVHYYAEHRFEGARGLALGEVAWIRWSAIAAIAAGVTLLPSSLFSYPTTPYALFREETEHEARGIERVTRHPFLAAMALFALGHVLLATHLVGTVFAAGFSVLVIGGALHQDRKLAAEKGPAFGRYVASTSGIPFLAILRGDQRLVARELPWGMLALGFVLALVLRSVHDSIFASGGVWVIAVVLGGAAVEVVQSLRRASRRRVRRGDEEAPAVT